MANKTASLKAILSQSKLQDTNNAAYQAIIRIIEHINSIQSSADIALSGSVTIVEIDTSSAPVTLALNEFVSNNTRIVVFKDISGNASSNNITLSGTVDSVVDPVISTDYGLMRIFLGANDGTFHEW